MYEFAELNEGHPLGDDSSEKLSTPSITSRRINALRRTKRSPKPCLPFQTTWTIFPNRISDRLRTKVYDIISVLPGIELRGDGGTNGSL